MRSSEINAVLGLTQIKRLDQNIKKRQKNLDFWLTNLNNVLYYKEYNIKGSSNYALPLILRKNNNKMKEVCKILEEEKVEYRLGTAGGGNQARQPYLERYGYKVVGNLEVSDYIHDYGLYIGNHPDLTEEEILHLCERLNNV